jgi:hypothetical protein
MTLHAALECRCQTLSIRMLLGKDEGHSAPRELIAVANGLADQLKRPLASHGSNVQ